MSRNWIQDFRAALPEDESAQVIILGGESAHYLSISRPEIDEELNRRKALRRRRKRRGRAIIRFRAARRSRALKFAAGTVSAIFILLSASLALTSADRASSDRMAESVSEELEGVTKALETYLGLTEHLFVMFHDTVHHELARIGIDLEDMVEPRGVIVADGSTGGSDSLPEHLLFRLSPRSWDLLSSDQTLRSFLMELPSARPMPQSRVSSDFGWRQDPLSGQLRRHEGIDLVSDLDPTVVASHSGEVTRAGRYGGYGLVVEVTNDWGVSTRYAHLQSLAVEQGFHVSKGDSIGIMGSTGRATGAHLHWEVRKNGVALDPNKVLDFTQEFGRGLTY